VLRFKENSMASRSTTLLVLAVVAIVCGTVLLFGFFIWPTPYRYEKVGRPYYILGQVSTKQEVYRINRFTGRAEKVVVPIPPKEQ
jgi:hypothetical protein